MLLASTHLTPFCSITEVLHTHTPASTQTNFYTNQLLHKHSFTPSTFSRSPLLHKRAFAQTRFSTNHLLHQPALTQTSFYTHRLLHLLRKQTFHQLAFTQTTFCTGQLLQTSFSTNQRLHNPTAYKQTNYKTNRFLRKPPFTPTSFTQPLLWACRPKARRPAECWKLLDSGCWYIILSSWL